jgi:PAS domain S-box-containing protein
MLNREAYLCDLQTVDILPMAHAPGDIMSESREQPAEWFRAAVEAAPAAILIVDREGRIVLANRETERQFAYPRDELLGASVELLMPERFRRDHVLQRAEFNAAPAARRMGMGRDLWGRRRDGSEFPAEIGLTPLQTDEGLFVVIAIVDITVRKELEETQRKLNEELEQCVEERTSELAHANEALARSNVELQQFAYIASHDLQTPLRGISGFAQLLHADYHGRLDENAHTYIERIVVEAKRMKALIDDLLTYSRVESRARPFEPIDLGEVFDEAVALLQSSIVDSGGEVTRGDLPIVSGDASQLLHLLQNLIENGLKYHGDQPPRVHVWAEESGGEWTVGVRDNGIGIDPQQHERIFDIFRRLHTQEQYPGTGIGLAVCRRIVARHGGRIWLTSTVGQGSEFLFTLTDGRNP